ncbi:MAG: hypothetical protein H0V83_05330 [Rubrobacter sp.]|nr:hypothetical protein [Rubrobacter sp.]
MEDTWVMEHWHGFQTARNIVRTYEITVSDVESGLSAHVVTVPARSLGGEDYLYRGRDEPFGSLGLWRVADVPFGGVTKSLAACLVSENVEEFLQKFHEGFVEETQHSSTELPKHFLFAEYLTFASVIPFEWSSLSTDSLGNILTAQGHGEAGYMYYEETQVPLLTIAIPSGMVICGSADGMARALASGLRERLAAFVKSRSAEKQDSDRETNEAVQRGNYRVRAEAIARTLGWRPVQSFCASTPW